jgi:hypothetical protein
MSLRAFAVLFGLLAGALPPAVRGEEAAREPARFLIEKITVAGTKEAAANIVRAETLLRVGESYTEDELRQAVYRVHRLPFVLDASFSLRKGSRRGAYELLVEVRPAHWFFYDAWARAFAFEQPLFLGNETFRGDRSSLALVDLVGARLFVGRSGAVFAALDKREGVQVGFTQYDLFHRGILASAGVSRDWCCVTEVLPLGLDPTFSAWTFDDTIRFSLGLSIPLGGAQSIQLAASERRGDRGDQQYVLALPRSEPISYFATVGTGLSYRRAEAKWVLDTSDDPVVPTRGLSLSAGLEASRFAVGDGQLLIVEQPSGPTTVLGDSLPLHSEQVVAAVSVIRHWPVTPHQTFSVRAQASGGLSRLWHLASDGTVFRAGRQTGAHSWGTSIGVDHALALRHSRTAGRIDDLRLESGVEVGAEAVSVEASPRPLRRVSIYTGLVFRNAWGRLRLTFNYLNFRGYF